MVPSDAVLRKISLARQQSAWVRSLGPKRYGSYFLDTYPAWDPVVCSLIYYRGRPVVATNGAVKLLGLSHRSDTDNFPDYGTDPRTLPVPPGHDGVGAWGHWRGTSVLHLREYREPVEHREVSHADLRALVTGCGPGLVFAAARSAQHSEFKGVSIGDDGKILPIHALPNALGYDWDDHSWIPSRWFTDTVSPSAVEHGHDIVMTSDGYPTLLRWVRVRQTERRDFYAVRIVTDEPTLEEFVSSAAIPIGTARPHDLASLIVMLTPEQTDELLRPKLHADWMAS